MYITLNSKNEPNPANFKNTFSQGLVIKPDSHICLVGAQITRINHNTIIRLKANGFLHIRTNPYDVTNIQLAAGTYTLQQFCDLINANFPDYTVAPGEQLGALIANYSVAASPAGTPDDQLLEIDVINMGINRNRMNFTEVKTHMGIGENYSTYLGRQITGIPLPSLVPNGNNAEGSLLGGNATIYASAPSVATVATPLSPFGYTIPTNQDNGNAMNIGRDVMNLPDNGFMIAQPNLTGIKFLVGKADYDVNNDVYTQAATFGGTQWANPTNSVNNCPFYISFKPDGTFEIYALNRTTNAFVLYNMAVGGVAYNPGDVFYIAGLRDDVTDPIVNPYAHKPLIDHISTNGMTMTYHMRLVNATPNYYQWNAYYPKANTLKEYSMNIKINEAQTIAEVDTIFDSFGDRSLDRPFGARVGTGLEAEGNYCDCNGQLGFQFLNQANPTASDIVLETGNARGYLNNTPFFKRYTDGAAPSNTADLRSSLLMSTQGVKTANKPFMFTYYFKLVDDTAKIPGGSVDQHTLLADNAGQRMVSVYPAQGAAHDVELFFSDGTLFQSTLTDGGGNRINLAYGTDYYMRVSYAEANTTFTIIVSDIATGTAFTVQHNANKEFNPFSSISSNAGGAVSYSKCLNGYFGHFRLHQLSEHAGLAADPFADTWTSLRNYYVLGNPRDKEWYWNADEDTYYDNDAAFTNIGLIHNLFTLTPVFHKDTMNPAVHDSNWGDIINPTFYHGTYIRNDKRKTDLPNADTYTGDEIGIADVRTTNPDNSDDLQWENVDRNFNVFTRVDNVAIDSFVANNSARYPFAADLKDIELDEKIINVEIPNLPHRSYNGVSQTQDKTIYQIPINGVNNPKKTRDNLDMVGAYPPTKTWIALNNPGEIPLNQLQVKLSDIEGKQLTTQDVQQETNVVVEIKARSEIIS